MVTRKESLYVLISLLVVLYTIIRYNVAQYGERYSIALYEGRHEGAVHLISLLVVFFTIFSGITWIKMYIV